MTARITTITYPVVKGLGLTQVGEVDLGPAGVRGDRLFHLVDADGRLINGKRLGTLVRVHATADEEGRTLRLTFPGGTVVDGTVTTGELVETRFYGRPVAGRLVDGAFSEALSAFTGQHLRLVRVEEPGSGRDRGVGAGVSVVSRGSLDRLAQEAGADSVDSRRFRMLFGIDGVEPHAEEGWVGRRVALGDAVVVFHSLVGRCAVTTQNPDTGVPDLDTLRLLNGYRAHVDSPEGLPLGVWGGVEQPGRVRVDDPVQPL